MIMAQGAVGGDVKAPGCLSDAQEEIALGVQDQHLVPSARRGGLLAIPAGAGAPALLVHLEARPLATPVKA